MTALEAVRSELREARKRVSALEKALAALEGAQAPRPRQREVVSDLGPVKTQVLAALPYEGSRRNLAEATGLPVSPVHRAMKELIDAGTVVNTGTHKFPVFERKEAANGRSTVVKPGEGMSAGRRIAAAR